MDSTCYSKKELDIIHFDSQLIDSFFTTHKWQAFDSLHKAFKRWNLLFPPFITLFYFFQTITFILYTNPSSSFCSSHLPPPTPHSLLRGLSWGFYKVCHIMLTMIFLCIIYLMFGDN